MRSVMIFAMAMLLVAGVWGSVGAQGRLVEDQITSPSLEGNLLGDPATRKMVIYLPSGYDASDTRYPVVYLIHGSGGNHRSWAYNEYPEFIRASFAPPTDFSEAGFAGMMDELIATGKMKKMILVMPDISTKYGGSYCINSALNGNYEDYIVKDIVPYIDAHYRTLPSRDSRGIDGISMGGYASIYLTMRNSSIFGAVSSHSGPLVLEASTRAVQPFIVAENPEGFTGPDPAKPVTSMLCMAASAMLPNLNNPPFFLDIPFDLDNNGAIIEETMQRLRPYDPVQMIPEHISDLASLRGIHLDGGDKDELGMGLIEQAFSEALTAAGIEHEFELFDGRHMDKLYTRLAIALSFFSTILEGEPTAVSPTTWGQIKARFR